MRPCSSHPFTLLLVLLSFHLILCHCCIFDSSHSHVLSSFPCYPPCPQPPCKSEHGCHDAFGRAPCCTSMPPVTLACPTMTLMCSLPLVHSGYSLDTYMYNFLLDQTASSSAMYFQCLGHAPFWPCPLSAMYFHNKA